MRVGAGRILVVEDEAPIRCALADVLRSEGYEVDTATNGAEALSTMRISCPDAVLLDLMMPVMDGWGLPPPLARRGVLRFHAHPCHLGVPPGR